MIYRVFYFGGGLSQKPGMVTLKLSRNAIKFTGVLKQSIDYSNLIDATTDYRVKEKGFSGGKAVAGALIAGPLGAVVGGSRGSEQVQSFVVIQYRLGSQEAELVVRANKDADRLQKDIQKRIGREPKGHVDPLKYHKAFYGAGFKGIKKLLNK